MAAHHPPPPEPSPQPRNAARDMSRWGKVVTTLLGLAGVVAAAYVGSSVANDGVIRSQQLAIQAAEEKATREKREGIYLGFLDAANNYAIDVVVTQQCVRSEIEDVPQRGEKFKIYLSPCLDTFDAVSATRAEFQHAYNQVAMFGSKEAEKAAGHLYGVLPLALATDLGDPFPAGDWIGYELDQDRFTHMYQAFQDVISEEMN